MQDEFHAFNKVDRKFQYSKRNQIESGVLIFGDRKYGSSLQICLWVYTSS